MANNDRIKKSDAPNKLPKPEIKIIMDGNSFYKPTMKTFFVDEVGDDGAAKEITFGGTYCSCNSVCTCESVSVCTCNPVATCSCVSHRVTTTPNTCSTHRPSSCSCVSFRGSGSCSCNKVCTCVPVT